MAMRANTITKSITITSTKYSKAMSSDMALLLMIAHSALQFAFVVCGS